MDRESRRLTEKEVQLVLRRAAELQEARGSELAEWGPTHAEVIKLGEELGMDGANLRTAVDEVLAGAGTDKAGGWRAISFESDRTYDTELTEDEWHELVQKLRSLFGRTGSVSEVAGAREWDGSHGVLDPIHLSARSKGGSTRVSIKSDLYGTAFIVGIGTLFPLLLIALAVTQVTKLAAIPELLIAASIFGAGVVAWASSMGWMGRRRLNAIKEVEKRLDEVARQRDRETPELIVEAEQVSSKS